MFCSDCFLLMSTSKRGRALRKVHPGLPALSASLLFSAGCPRDGFLPFELSPQGEDFYSNRGFHASFQAVPRPVNIDMAGPKKPTAIPEGLFCPLANQPTVRVFSSVILVYIVSIVIRMFYSDCFLLSSTSKRARSQKPAAIREGLFCPPAN